MNAEELGRILDEYFIRQNKYERFYGSHNRRFIFGVIQSPAEVLVDPQFEHRQFFVDVTHPQMGPIKFPGAPFRMEATPWEPGDVAPTVGQDNTEVLQRRLDLTEARLAELTIEGII